MEVDPPSTQQPVNPNNPSYVQNLLNENLFTILSNGLANFDMADEVNPANFDANFISILAAKKLRLCPSWKKSVIIKVVGWKIGHQILKKNL